MGGPVMPRSKSRAIVRSLVSCGLSRWPIPGGRTQVEVRRSYNQSAVRLPRLAPMAWWIGESTWRVTNTAETNESGRARSSPRSTAPTSRPIAMANRAGRTPRSTSTAHQAIARGPSACGKTWKNFHSLRARSCALSDEKDMANRSPVKRKASGNECKPELFIGFRTRTRTGSRPSCDG